MGGCRKYHGDPYDSDSSDDSETEHYRDAPTQALRKSVQGGNGGKDKIEIKWWWAVIALGILMLVGVGLFVRSRHKQGQSEATSQGQPVATSQGQPVPTSQGQPGGRDMLDLAQDAVTYMR